MDKYECPMCHVPLVIKSLHLDNGEDIEIGSCPKCCRYRRYYHDMGDIYG